LLIAPERRKIPPMSSGFATGKELVDSLPFETESFTRDVRANEKFHLSLVHPMEGN
jgi:hypothetical protein